MSELDVLRIVKQSNFCAPQSGVRHQADHAHVARRTDAIGLSFE